MTYENPGGQLFVNGPEYDDIDQNALGDCYLLSALSAVALTDPQRIRNMITPLGNNRYRVRFYSWQLFRGYVAHYETVEATFPTQNGRLIYGTSTDSAPGGGIELWVAIVEKAYAQWHGGYDDIEGGSAERALEHITGVEADTVDVDDLSGSALVTRIANEIRGGHPVCADTPGSGKKVEANGFVTGHSYTVVSADASAGTITVRNPWGRPNQTVTAAVFRDVFVRLRIGDA